jgi:hypothetical protein
LLLVTAFVITRQVTLNVTYDDNLIAAYIYVVYGNPKPDRKTKDRVKDELEKHNIVTDDLVEWNTDGCV